MKFVNTITFDRGCPGWIRNQEVNRHALDKALEYVNEILMARGYIYLNQIYEAIHAIWNPDIYNKCYKAEDGPLCVDIREHPKDESALLIDVYQ